MLRQCCGSRIRCCFDPWNRDPDGKKNQIWDPDPWTGINIADNNSKSLVKIFGVENSWILCWGSRSRIRCLFDTRPGTGKFYSRINIPDPHHCVAYSESDWIHRSESWSKKTKIAHKIRKRFFRDKNYLSSSRGFFTKVWNPSLRP
jgi:hypothetical protein